ncbi:hypothetical protein SLEP1_g53243 [Rubroshorea leprosula]|uniref:Uncharacterized protein n=1 Tax=Rubroshorea leprosula TaxID=152421 RepID=A0AAV5MAM4_9ROSI|nr:hypothetical protein SLEP1_g53243 [Rubroshorea leprosula]
MRDPVEEMKSWRGEMQSLAQNPSNPKPTPKLKPNPTPTHFDLKSQTQKPKNPKNQNPFNPNPKKKKKKKRKRKQQKEKKRKASGTFSFPPSILFSFFSSLLNQPCLALHQPAPNAPRLCCPAAPQPALYRAP